MSVEINQEQEMVLAYKQKRKPDCVHCKFHLNEVRQQNEDIVWR